MDKKQLIARYVEENPNKPGPEEARIVGSYVAVWALTGYYRAVSEDLERVARDYDLPLDAVRAALAYYRDHREAIDARLAANAA